MGIRFGLLSTYPPTECGIATFSRSLAQHLEAQGAHVEVVRPVGPRGLTSSPGATEWRTDEPGGARRVARALSESDVCLVQHEYGIYGGADGEDLLEVLSSVTVPVISVLHTVLARPTPNQYRVLAGVCAESAAVVTMTRTARDRLVDGWGIAPERIAVIGHGADAGPQAEGARPHEVGHRPVVLTWGLLGEGKGIEWGLRALAGLGDLVPPPLYRVVGQTHPRVLEREGEAYRERLHSIVGELELHADVAFDASYLPRTALQALVRDADVVLLPYDSREQVTSGVLVEAVAAGKPVVATAFPHAVELLSGGAGLLVPQQDAAAIGAALRRVLTEPGLAADMADAARTLAPSLLWSAVARAHLSLARQTVRSASASVA
ncbi:glycosyltransferase [Arthrobacter sp. NEB 688]|uniref:glycosyltransferase n=1 Tax=Arthrobacter sp. NEB 688 TaxID=904039 RepID=UPI001564D2C0|nr:glycosyltransferase [Arthrobacter sp. NEB 688]QKE85094.1 glycosyltransferase [Arthrobacter sp. NEB 688]